MITTNEYQELKRLQAIYEKWAKQFLQKNGWTVIPADAIAPVKFTNADRSAIELYEFCFNPPDKYSVYVHEIEGLATTWTGEELGRLTLGPEYQDNFGGKRQSVRITAINGREYVGTYYKSAGDYARVRLTKHSKMVSVS